MFRRIAPLLGVALLSCGADEEPAASCNGVELLVAASDLNYTTSLVCGAPGCVKNSQTSNPDFGGDPTLAVGRGRAFFLARLADLLFELDPACGTLRERTSLGAFGRNGRPANPHDLAVAPDGTLVLPLYAAGKLAFLPPNGAPAELDLSGSDPDGSPQPESIAILGDKAFVALERLDDTSSIQNGYLTSKQSSQLLRIDLATRAVEATFELAGRNPFNAMSEVDGVLFMAMPRDLYAAEEELAGIERFDTRDSTTRLVVEERGLGGSITEVAVTQRCGAAIVAGPEKNVNPTSVITFDPDTGAVGAPLIGPTPGFDLHGLAWRGDTLYVGDRRQTSAGYIVHVFQRSEGCRVTDAGRTILLPQRPVALRAAAAR